MAWREIDHPRNPAGLARGVSGAFRRASGYGDDADLGPPPLPDEPVPMCELADMIGRQSIVRQSLVVDGLDDLPIVHYRRRDGDAGYAWWEHGVLVVDDNHGTRRYDARREYSKAGVARALPALFDPERKWPHD